MKRGFTLIELLIVIAILAILATVVVLVINPGEMLKQARDSQRISDLNAINRVLGMYVATVKNPDLGDSAKCYNGAAANNNCTGRHPKSLYGASDNRSVDGTGWLPVSFTSIPGGSPLPALPLDPVNNNVLFYSYSPSSVAWELNADLESERYRQGGSDDKETTDGGNQSGLYEVGSDPGLDT